MSPHLQSKPQLAQRLLPAEGNEARSPAAPTLPGGGVGGWKEQA